MSKTTIEISGDSSGFKEAAKDVSKNLEGIKKDAEKSAKGSSQAFSVFLGTFSALALQKAFSTAVNGFKSFIGAMKESVELAKIQQEAINELDNALVRTGKFTRETSKDFQDFASQLQSTSKFGDEAILKNAALIQSFGNLSVDGLKQATSASVDLAAALGKDLGTASNLLGQAAAGNTASLSRLGIRIESTGDKAKDFALVLEKVNEKFGGAALAQLNTFDGATTQLGNTYGDLREILGGLVVENKDVIGGIRQLEQGFQTLGVFLKENETLLRAIATEGFQAIVIASSFVVQAIGDIAGAFFKAREAFLQFQNADQIQFLEEKLSKLPEQIDIYGERVETFYETSLRNQIQALKGEREADANAFQERIDLLAQFREKIKGIEANVLAGKEIRSQQEIDIEREKLSELARLREEAKLLEDEQKFTEADLFIQGEEERLNYIRDILGQEEALKEEARARELAAAGDYNAARASLEAANVKARKADIFTIKKFEELSQSERIANMKSTLGIISSLQSSSSKELFAIGKASAIATATIDGIAAVQKALASAPPPFNIALASIVGIATAANIGKIASAKPPTGAFNGALVEGGSMMRDTEPFMLSKGEIVAPRRSFDEVVEGTARQRGFVKGNESGGKNVTVNIDTLIGQDQFINDMIEKIREKILFENADLGVA